MPEISLQAVLKKSNLLAAWEKVRSNQGAGGIDGVSISQFASKLAYHLETLKNEVHYDTYRPLPLLRVYIDKPSGDGQRPLSIPCIRDRVLQTAVALVLTPAFEAEFEDISFAYRQGRSVEQAVNLIERLRDKGYQWIVDADIHRYFDEVNHDLLLKEVKKLVSDKGILKLIRLWIKAFVVDGKQRFRLTKGIPQGSPLSPLLANLYLDHLDDTLLDKNLRLVRYADDFVVLCKTKKKAQQALALTEDVLKQLQLHFNNNKTRIVDFNSGMRFLGVTFIRSLAFKSEPPPKRDIPSSLPKTQPGRKKSSRIQQKRSRKHKKDTKPDWFSYALPTGTDYTSTAEMREAFAEAGIVPQQFPSESAPDTHLQPPTVEKLEQQTSQGHHPRMKTLYLMQHGAVLGKEYERFTIRQKGKPVRQIPAIHVDQIMIFGNSQITTQAMQFCLQERIPIYLLTGKGRYYGMIDSFSTEPVLLHRKQFERAADSEFALQLAIRFIQGKVANTRLLHKRLGRHRDLPALQQAKQPLKQIQTQLPTATTLDQLRGFEGSAARIHFQAIAASLDASWNFDGRNKQPPTDPVNAMLSYGYTLLYYNIYSFLRSRGLNPHIGYLHPMRMGHPALVSDLMEEFRAIVVDAVVFNLVFNHKISPHDFSYPKDPVHACLLNDKARNLFTEYLENKFNSKLTHPVSHLKLDYRRCMEHQVNHLAAVIQGKESQYQPLVLT